MAELPSWMILDTDDQWNDVEVESKVSQYSFYKDSPEGETVLYYDDSAHEYYRYDAEGNRVDVPGVTTVLKDVGPAKPLMIWAVKLAIETARAGLVNEDGTFKQLSTEDFNFLLDDAQTKHDQELKEAGDVGHVVHGLLEDAIKKAIKDHNGVLQPLEFVHVDERVNNSTGAAVEWAQKHKVRFIFTERKVYSKTFDVAGTGDGLAWVSSCDDCTCCKFSYVDRLGWVDFKTSKSLRTTYLLQAAIYRFAYIEETGEPVTDTWILKLDKITGKLKALHRGPETFEIELEAFLSCLKLYRDMELVESSLSAQNAEQRSARKAVRDAAKAIQEAQEREERRLAKIERMRLTKERNEAKDAHYKALRAGGLSPSEAKAETALKFPAKAVGAKEDKVDPEPKVLVPAVVKTFEEEWTRTL
jgi:hypothetical protein